MIVVELGCKWAAAGNFFDENVHLDCVTCYGRLCVDCVPFHWYLGNGHVRVHPNDSNGLVGESYPYGHSANMLGHHSLSHDNDRFEVDYDNYHASRSA